MMGLLKCPRSSWASKLDSRPLSFCWALIRLQHIYFFVLCYYSINLGCFIYTFKQLYIISCDQPINLVPSASCCFCLFFYIAENQYQMESKCSKTFWRFFGPQDIQWAREAPGDSPRGEQPTRACLGAQAHPGGLCPPRWPPVPPLYPINSQKFQKPSGLT